jgi:hypothetical protein
MGEINPESLIDPLGTIRRVHKNGLLVKQMNSTLEKQSAIKPRAEACGTLCAQPSAEVNTWVLYTLRV